jgi:hypothetical protein
MRHDAFDWIGLAIAIGLHSFHPVYPGNLIVLDVIGLVQAYCIGSQRQFSSVQGAIEQARLTGRSSASGS